MLNYQVITSKMEGFCIPIIEAMRNKCKILASDIDTLKKLAMINKIISKVKILIV